MQKLMKSPKIETSAPGLIKIKLSPSRIHHLILLEIIKTPLERDAVVKNTVPYEPVPKIKNDLTAS